MGVTTFTQNDFTAQGGTNYKTNLDANIKVLSRFGDWFAPHAQASPNMTIALDPGFIWDGVTLTNLTAQSCSAITAPITNPRIDRIVVNAITGVVSIVPGAENASPTAPAFTLGQIPIAQVLLQTSTTAITNAMITDERVFPGMGGNINVQAINP